MTLNAGQRQSYLAAMGIHTYFPRFILPGAKPSALETWPQTKEEGKQEKLTQQQIFEPEMESQTNQSGENLQAFVVEKTKRTSSHFESEVVVESGSKMKQVVQANDDNLGTHSEVRFQLVFIRVNADICILNQVPYLGVNQALSPAHKNLLDNILSALGVVFESIQFDEVDPFRWPFSEHFENTVGAAQAALKGYLEQQCSVVSFTTLIVMGEVAASYTEPLSIDDKQAWNIVNIRSLDEILNRWQYKRDAWQQLKMLRNSLLRNSLMV